MVESGSMSVGRIYVDRKGAGRIYISKKLMENLNFDSGEQVIVKVLEKGKLEIIKLEEAFGSSQEV